MSKRIKIENEFYISADSTYADNKVFVLNQGETFGVFDRWGDISMVKDVQGLYHEGTRFISELEFKINTERPVLLSSAMREENDLFYADLTNTDSVTEKGLSLLKGSIHVYRTKFVKKGVCYEKIMLVNYSQIKLEFPVSFSVNADFKDIFEIRGTKRLKRGHITDINKNPERIIFTYKGLDNIKRTTELNFQPPPDIIENDKVGYNVSLESREIFEINLSMHFQLENVLSENGHIEYSEAYDLLNEQIQKEKSNIAHIATSNQFFNHWINRSRVDLVSLMASTPYGRYPYAGVPWYNTPFGRDGIITALEVLWISPAVAKGVLLYLAKTQSMIKSDYQDAEPGKIFHETRTGEMAELGEIPFKLYYGTVDATPLFIVLAGEYYKRTADLETIKIIWPNIQAALRWIDEFGDIDGDGFVEYKHVSEKGLYNQGWKDSFDSVSHENGDLANSPITLCEVQGYVYDAKKNAAFLAEVLGYKEVSITLSKQAETLKEKFNKVFWDEELETFVLALDENKKPCRIKSSNAGHCLFSGIVNPYYANHLASTLLSKEMFSGWGIRTLSSDTIRYNPMSYHNGSIWPHDNALIAYGLSKYGFQENVLKILKGLYEATLFIDMQRLPELFCGFRKRKGEGPIAYPVACSPQAWAVGALYLLLQACLRLEINALEKKVLFKGSLLPDFLDAVTIEDLLLEKTATTFVIRREDDKGNVTVKSMNLPEGWTVLEQ